MLRLLPDPRRCVHASLSRLAGPDSCAAAKESEKRDRRTLRFVTSDFDKGTDCKMNDFIGLIVMISPAFQCQNSAFSLRPIFLNPTTEGVNLSQKGPAAAQPHVAAY